MKSRPGKGSAEKERGGHHGWRHPLHRARLRFLGLFGHPVGVQHRLRAAEGQLLRWVAFSALVGVLTGALVAVFDFVLRDEAIVRLYQVRSTWAYLLFPAAGIAAAAALIRYAVPSREGALTEDYILVYHDAARQMRPSNIAGKLLAAFATIASGGSVGLEGPSIYLGAAVGDGLQRRAGGLFRAEDRKLLLVAGAAAGVAAIFKAPLTGVIFALEVPYRDRMAGRALVPALVSSASAYVTFALLAGSEPLFSHGHRGAFDLQDILLALLLGALCGVGARLFAWLLRATTRALAPLTPWARALAAGLGVGALGVGVFQLAGEPYLFGPGYRLLHHVLDAPPSLEVLAFFLGAKAVACALTLAGGGVGGIFFPMAVLGALSGALFGSALGRGGDPLYPLVGLAAFVGAGYRTPMAAVAFVAETTGNPWALIPAMLATVVGFLVMGRSGVSEHQRDYGAKGSAPG